MISYGLKPLKSPLFHRTPPSSVPRLPRLRDKGGHRRDAVLLAAALLRLDVARGGVVQWWSTLVTQVWLMMVNDG